MKQETVKSKSKKEADKMDFTIKERVTFALIMLTLFTCLVVIEDYGMREDNRALEKEQQTHEE